MSWFTKIIGFDAVIERLEIKIMGQLENLVTALDAETNAVASRLDRLTQELKDARANNQMPKIETLDALRLISDRLKALGSDPADPIPAPAPTEVPPAEAPTEPTPV